LFGHTLNAMGLNVIEFTQQSVRDLAWAISSPPLMSQVSRQCVWPQENWFRQLYMEVSPWMEHLDNDSSELDELLARQKDRRMGKYFETLWYFWLCNQSRYDIVENNVQINIDGETLGELDFILFDNKEKKTLHWELAVKFYLGVGDTREMSNWHGPNRHDRLDIKVEHLVGRQSVIGEDFRVARWLKQQSLSIDSCAVILKGRLYFPLAPGREAGAVNARFPPQCSDELSYSYWFKQKEFEEVFDDKQRFKLLINEGWMEKIPTTSANALYSKRGIFEAISNGVVRLPLHLQPCKPCSIKDRVFLVDDNWS